MGTAENQIIKRILSEQSEDERLFRINAGMAWVGKTTRRRDGIVTIHNAFPFHGAPVGWPDLAGWKTVTITPDMVGKKIAVFQGKEVKATGKLSREQELFGKVLKGMGGLFEVVN